MLSSGNDIEKEGINSFQEIEGLNKFLIRCLKALNFKRPTPIQYHSIRNLVSEGPHTNSNQINGIEGMRHLIAQSKSGTGKTLAYLLPILNLLMSDNKHPSQKETQALVIVPTRELAIQVYQQLKALLHCADSLPQSGGSQGSPSDASDKAILSRKITTHLCIGGIPLEDDTKTLIRTGAHVIVGTVGRVYQLIFQKTVLLKQNELKFVVFDEGDKLWAAKDKKLGYILSSIRSVSTQIQETQSASIVQEPQNVDSSKSSPWPVRFLVFSATFTLGVLNKLMKDLSFRPTKFNCKRAKSGDIAPLHLQKAAEEQFLFVQTLKEKDGRLHEIVTSRLSELKFSQEVVTTVDSAEVKKPTAISENILNLENISKYCLSLNQQSKRSQNCSDEFLDPKSVMGVSLLQLKCQLLKQILTNLPYQKCLVFVEKKALLEQIYSELLKQSGEQQIQKNALMSQEEFESSLLMIHGSMSQSARIKLLNRCQRPETKVVLASDLLARGIDLVLDLVVLFDCSSLSSKGYHAEEDTFWHRIGRTGRYGRKGVVISLDKISGWKPYDHTAVQEQLKCISLPSHNSQNQSNCCQNQNSSEALQESERKVRVSFGNFLTEYGRWEEVDEEKQHLINLNYNFFDDKGGKAESQKRGSPKINKKQKITRKNEQCRKDGESQCQDNPMGGPGTAQQNSTTNKDKQQMLRQIMGCEKCRRLIESTEALTSYDFKIKSLFEGHR